LNKLGLNELSYSLSTGKFDTDNVGIREIFSRKYLENIDFEEVSILNAFWQNRFSKEIKNINEGIFAIDTLGLWQSIADGKKELKIDDEILKAVYLKIQVQDAVCRNGIIENIDKTKLGKKDEKTGESYVKVPIEGMVETIERDLGAEYNDIFEKYLPSSEHNLSRDIYNYIPLYNNKENVYHNKNIILRGLVRKFSNSKKIKNWGYIPEKEKYNEKDTNSIKKQEKFILIGIDYEGFNMPIKLHIERNLLSEFLRAGNDKAIIPIYEGEQDMFYNGSLMSCHVLMPLGSMRKKAITKFNQSKCVNNYEKNNLIEHLAFLSDAKKYPEHLKETVVNRGERVLARPEKKYIDIDSGEEYYKDKIGGYFSKGKGRDSGVASR
jgi:hypothetical protein